MIILVKFHLNDWEENTQPSPHGAFCKLLKGYQPQMLFLESAASSSVPWIPSLSPPLQQKEMPRPSSSVDGSPFVNSPETQCGLCSSHPESYSSGHNAQLTRQRTSYSLMLWILHISLREEFSNLSFLRATKGRTEQLKEKGEKNVISREAED